MTSGPLSTAIVPVRTAISESASFQSRVGASDATEALNRIHVYMEEGEFFSGIKRPACVLTFNSHGFAQIAAGPTLIAHGGISILFTDNAPPGQSEDDSFIDFADWVGDVLDDLVATGSLDATFPLMSLMATQLPARTPRNERTADEDFWVCQYTLTYGEGEEG